MRLQPNDMNMKMNERSDRKLKILSALAIVAIGCLCWNGGTPGNAQATPATQSPQLQEVVKLTQAKMSDDVILSYIKNSGASYNLSADDILYLNSQGVTQPVISALLAAKSSVAAAPAPAPALVATPTTPAPQISPYPGATATPGPVPTAPPVGGEVNLTYFQTQLAPYGQWVDVPGQGLSWVPAVQMTTPDWRPYFNAGHWVYTDDGWSWQSDYPWGEYTFHYGRWFRDPRLGWAWVPGYHWGPAWVCWRHSEGENYCGWAPLPPDAIFEPGVGLMWHGRPGTEVAFGLGPEAFVFIPYDHFWEHDYVGWRAPFDRVPFLFRASLLANHYSFIGGRFVFEGIGRDRIGILTHHSVGVERLEFHDSHIGFDHGHIGHDGHDGHEGHFP
jgi:hypothetical protein